MTEHQSFSPNDPLDEETTAWPQRVKRDEKPDRKAFLLERLANFTKELESSSDPETNFQKLPGNIVSGDQFVTRIGKPSENEKSNGGMVTHQRLSEAGNGSPQSGALPVAPVPSGLDERSKGSNHGDEKSEKRNTINAGADGFTLNAPVSAEAEEHKVDQANPGQVIVNNNHGQFIHSSSNRDIPAAKPGLEDPEENSDLTPVQPYSPQSNVPVRKLAHSEIGSYLITGELGRGGMGVVYKAHHKVLHRDVALKMILRADHDATILSRFHFEAQSVATLKHPGIVEIYEYGEEGGIPWFALEFVDGKTLSQLTNKEPIDPVRAAKITADLASAIAYAHEQGVLHRDIKPANVLVAKGDIAKLTDFGLAKRDSTEESDHEITEPKTIDGQVLGTPGYMPPEQARGDHESIGPHSDQYSLGATLYYLLTGRAPFVGRPLEFLLSQVIEKDPLSVRQLQPSIPLDLETICLKAMSKEPSRRYPDCAAMEADLRRFLRNEPIVARPISGVERSIRWCRRNPRIASPVATAIFSVLTALSVSVWSAVTLAKKNADIEQQKNLAVEAKNLADENAKIAEQNFKLARERAIQSKNSISQMLLAIRENIPINEKKLRPVREQLLQIASKQLDLLPDESDDIELRTGLEKARVLQERYLTALELGQPSKAIEYLDTAEEILRKRNASISTDVTRLNLTTLLHHQAYARVSIRRDMKRVRELGDESLQILQDILARPNPAQFDIPHGSVPRIDTLTQVMVQGYQHALTLKKLGLVKEGFNVIEFALGHFAEAMAVLRAGPFQQLNDEEWARQKQLFRGMVSDQDQLRTNLLASIGRDQEAAGEQSRILERLRAIADSDKSQKNWANLSFALMIAGDLARQRGHIDEALELYEESVRITREFYQDDSSLEDRRNRHQISLSRLAGLLRSRDLNRARNLYAEAQQVAQEMVRADSESIVQHMALALVSPFSDSPDSAVEQAEDILKRNVPGDAEMSIDLARVWSASAESERLSPAPDFEKIERWKQEALKRIEDAVAFGYRDRAYLAGEPDFDAIKLDGKFQELLRKCTDGP